MTSRSRKFQTFSIPVVAICATLISGCGATIDETADNAKNFGIAVGSSAKEAGLKVGDAFNKTFRAKKGSDKAPTEIDKAKPAYEEPKKQKQ